MSIDVRRAVRRGMDRIPVRALSKARRERAERMAAEIAVEMELTASDILGRSRIVPLPRARHELMRRLWLTGMTLSDVARTLGMDHTSVLHGLRAVLGDEYAALSAGPGRVR